MILHRRLLLQLQIREEQRLAAMEARPQLTRGQVLMREEAGILAEEEIDVLTSFSLCFSGLSVSMIMMNRLMTSYENDNSVQRF